MKKPVAKKKEPAKQPAAKKTAPVKKAVTVKAEPVKKPAPQKASADKKPVTKKTAPVQAPAVKPPKTTAMRPATLTPKTTVNSVPAAGMRQISALKPNYEMVHPKSGGRKAAAQRQPTRTPFKEEELEAIKQLLLDERAEKLKLQSVMSNDALSRPDEENVEEDGSNSANRADMLARAEETRKRLRAIDDALRAIENKTYGICSVCKCAISRERLKAAPFAIRCVKCKAEWERQMQASRHNY
ncbi:MAG: TraR/DksA C4-type zinc finger protein [Kiritimatiellae bacterium]|nr:TraR/DksA C4-type zinc finger protein [Kiritimatiellia bacterium]